MWKYARVLAFCRYIMSITIAIRVRPFTRFEESRNPLTCVTVANRSVSLSAPEASFQCAVDIPLWSHSEPCEDSSVPYTSNRDLYLQVGKRLVDSAKECINSCVFTYGGYQSGKTYCLHGTPDDPGLIYTVGLALLETMPRYAKLTISVASLYLERLNDALLDFQQWSASNLRIKESPNGDIDIVNLSTQLITSPIDIEPWVSLATRNWNVYCTSMSTRSSLQYSLTYYKIWLPNNDANDPVEKAITVLLVDFAGFPIPSRINVKPLAESIQRYKTHATFQHVIAALSDQSKSHFVPFRDSKLTRLLQNPLISDWNTVMLATISPDVSEAEHTLTTLRVGNRVGRIDRSRFVRRRKVVKKVEA